MTVGFDFRQAAEPHCSSKQLVVDIRYHAETASWCCSVYFCSLGWWVLPDICWRLRVPSWYWKKFGSLSPMDESHEYVCLRYFPSCTRWVTSFTFSQFPNLHLTGKELPWSMVRSKSSSWLISKGNTWCFSFTLLICKYFLFIFSPYW